ncbi:uncharacterized protein UBRO_20833 [Ustilago bromivora]|uniref:Uncharacterized protein n=1 Tax=Ustilago bromivora TaxID=307758 RepID=A0A1K0G9E2_9BASI|nr:uncharacterized protein UBRO_20833 [Ustilago bromivora]
MAIRYSFQPEKLAGLAFSQLPAPSSRVVVGRKRRVSSSGSVALVRENGCVDNLVSVPFCPPLMMPVLGPLDSRIIARCFSQRTSSRIRLPSMSFNRVRSHVRARSLLFRRSVSDGYLVSLATTGGCESKAIMGRNAGCFWCRMHRGWSCSIGDLELSAICKYRALQAQGMLSLSTVNK